MAVTFGTASFEVEIGSKMRPDWVQADGVVVQHIPYSNVDDIQFAGRGSHTIRVNIHVSSDTHWNTLKTYVGDGVARSLTGFFGGTVSSVYLKSLSGQRSDFAQEWEGVAEFIRAGS